MRLRNIFDKSCRMFSLLFTFCQTFGLLLGIWFGAWFNPDKWFLVTINQYGESFPELIFWILVTPFVIYGLYLNSKSIIKNEVY